MKRGAGIVLAAGALLGLAVVWLARPSGERGGGAGPEKAAAQEVADPGPGDVEPAAPLAEGEGAPLRREAVSVAAKPEVMPSGSEQAAVGEEVGIIVVGPDGDAISEASVRLNVPLDRTGKEMLELDGKTSASGRAEFRAPPSDYVGLVVEAEGFFHLAGANKRRPEIRVELARAGRLNARVLDAGTREPLEGARVRNVHQAPCVSCAEDGETDAEGRLALTVACGRRSNFLVRFEDYPATTFRLQVPPDATTVDHDFLLDRGAGAVLEVVDFSTGEPIDRVQVQDSSRGLELGRTDESGRHAFRILPSSWDGRVEFELTRKGYCSLKCFFDPHELAANVPTRIRLPRAVSVVGMVHDANGNALKRVNVRVEEDSASAGALAHKRRQSGNDPWHEYPEDWHLGPEVLWPAGISHENGWYETAGVLPWGGRHTVTYLLSEYRTHTETIETTGDPGAEIRRDVTLARQGANGELRGRVTFNGSSVASRVSWQGESRNGSTKTDETGDFSFRDVESGEVRLRVIPAGYTMASAVFDGENEHVVHLEPGASLECDVVLKLPTSPISGTVRLVDGTPRAEQTVLVLGTRHRVRLRATTDESGNYAVDAPDLGHPFIVSFYYGRENFKREGVLAGSSGIDFELPQLGILEFKILDAHTGSPLPRFQLYVRRGDAPDFSRVSMMQAPGPGGWYSVWLAEGALDVLVTSEKLGYAQRKVEGITVGPKDAPGREIFRLEPAPDEEGG